MKPFSYVLTHKPSGKRYYGIRISKNADPSQLWISYFSSSKIIKKMIEDEGKEVFSYQVRRVFETREGALRWETKFLTKIKAKDNPLWLNRHNGGKKFTFSGQHSAETKQAISQKLKGRKFTTEHKRKIASKSTWTGKLTPEQIKNRKVYRGEEWMKIHQPGVDKMRLAKTGTKRQYLPDGSFRMIKL